MTTKRQQVWSLVRRQHGVITRQQLLANGFSDAAIRHRLANGRLHPVHRGVYSVGRPHLGRPGTWMAAVLSCGERAALSHASAAELWGLAPEGDRLEVSAPPSVCSRSGIVVHRRTGFEVVRHRGIPVTTVICTVVDLSVRLPAGRIEAVVNRADSTGLVDLEMLRAALNELPHRRGVAKLARILDRRTFMLTDSELERRFRRVMHGSPLGEPETGWRLNGFKVDFYWPHLGLIVETDGLRYHRTPEQQAHDRLRDQAHTAAGLTVLRFTHAQVAFDPSYVRATVIAVGRRLTAARRR